VALNGPLAAPARSIDVSALTGWLTLRAVDNQAKQLRELENAQRLREIENARRQREIENAKPQAKPPAPKSEAAPALPPPLDIRPLPMPQRSSPPEALVGPQH
jgi:large subunit ribosomal protein L24